MGLSLKGTFTEEDGVGEGNISEDDVAVRTAGSIYSSSSSTIGVVKLGIVGDEEVGGGRVGSFGLAEGFDFRRSRPAGGCFSCHISG